MPDHKDYQSAMDKVAPSEDWKAATLQKMAAARAQQERPKAAPRLRVAKKVGIPLAAAAAVPGLTEVRVTAEKGDEVSFTAASTDGADHRAALSAALAAAGCPVLSLTSQQMSLEDVFLQLTGRKAVADDDSPDDAGAPTGRKGRSAREKEARR